MQTWGVTFEQVADVCDKLLNIGQKPTVRSVRSELGTGSNSTLLAHLKTWQTKQHIAQAENSNADLFSEEFKLAFRAELHQHLQTQENRFHAQLAELEDRESATDEALRSAEIRIQDLITAMDKLKTANLQAMQSVNIQLEKKSLANQNLEVQLNSLNQALAVAKSDLHLIKTDYSQLKMQQQEEQIQARYTNQQQEKLHRDIAQLTAKNDALKSALNQEKERYYDNDNSNLQKIALLEERLIQATRANQHKRTKVEHLEKAEKGLLKEINSLKDQLHVDDSTTLVLKTDVLRLENELVYQRKREKELHQQIVSITKENQTASLLKQLITSQQMLGQPSAVTPDPQRK